MKRNLKFRDVDFIFVMSYNATKPKHYICFLERLMSCAYGCPDTKLASRLLMPTILGVLIVGILFLTVGGFFGAIGAFLIFLGSSGNVDAAWTSPGFEITNVGILLLFIAGSIVVVTLERVFKNVQAFVNRLDVNFLKR